MVTGDSISNFRATIGPLEGGGPSGELWATVDRRALGVYTSVDNFNQDTRNGGRRIAHTASHIGALP
jgi:hypothetical protein